MSSFHACCIALLFVIVALLLVIAIALTDYAKTVKNQLWKIIDNTRPIDVCGNGAWQTVLQIRDNFKVLLDILNNDGDGSKTTDTGEGWVIVPCPVCGGPPSMHYDHDSQDGYFVMCDKNCGYGIITGGSTRKAAALEWNRAAVTYCNKMEQLSMTKEDSDD